MGLLNPIPRSTLHMVEDEGLTAILVSVHHIMPVGWIPDRHSNPKPVFRDTKQLKQIMDAHFLVTCANAKTEDLDADEQEVVYDYIKRLTEETLKEFKQKRV